MAAPAAAKDSIAADFKASINERRRRLQAAITGSYEAERAALSDLIVQAKELDTHFGAVESELRCLREDLAAREKSFEIKVEETRSFQEKLVAKEREFEAELKETRRWRSNFVAREMEFEAQIKETRDTFREREVAVAAKEEQLIFRGLEASANDIEEKRLWLEERARLESKHSTKAAVHDAITPWAKDASASPERDGSLTASTSETVGAKERARLVAKHFTKAAVHDAITPWAKDASASLERNGSPAASTSETVGAKERARLKAKHSTKAAVHDAITPRAKDASASLKRDGSPAVSISETVAAKEEVAHGPTSENLCQTYRISASPTVSLRVKLKSICYDMDADGLRENIVTHGKDVCDLRVELSSALLCANDPAGLVLTVLDGCEPGAFGGEAHKEESVRLENDSRILLLECLAALFAEHPMVLSNVKEFAKKKVDKWLAMIKVTLENPESGGDFVDVHAFLRLLETFGFASEYSDRELCELVAEVSEESQFALCQSLGLSTNIPNYKGLMDRVAVLDRLVENNKPIRALFLGHSLGIMDRLQPVTLLRNHLTDTLVTTQITLRDGLLLARTTAKKMELDALNAVLQCIEQCGLQNRYPSAPLRERVAQLEGSRGYPCLRDKIIASRVYGQTVFFNILGDLHIATFGNDFPLRSRSIG